VKRMLIAVGNEVTHLKRTQIWPRSLEQVPACGWLELSPDAISLALWRKITT
jgi:16S rRNA U516 pseudouridylate synthase RsuA-like enzyme